MDESIILNRINKLIKENNITPNKLVVSCGLQGNAITKWKTGFAKPSLDACIKIADYFNVSLDYLVGRDTTTQSSKDMQNNATKDPLLNKLEQLSELQKEKAMSYIDAMIDFDNSAFIKGQEIGRKNIKETANQSRIRV